MVTGIAPSAAEFASRETSRSVETEQVVSSAVPRTSKGGAGRGNQPRRHNKKREPRKNEKPVGERGPKPEQHGGTTGSQQNENSKAKKDVAPTIQHRTNNRNRKGAGRGNKKKNMEENRKNASNRKSDQKSSDQNEEGLAQSNIKKDKKRNTETKKSQPKEAVSAESDSKKSRKKEGKAGKASVPKSDENKKVEPSRRPSGKNKNRNNGRTKEAIQYPLYSDYDECLRRYAENDPDIIRGRLRVLQKKNGMAFVSCDRGSQVRDTVVEIPLHRNRALDGDIVFVELLPVEKEEEEEKEDVNTMEEAAMDEQEIEDSTGAIDIAMEELEITNEETEAATPAPGTWQDDAEQMRLWNPLVPVRKMSQQAQNLTEEIQRKGQVIFVVPPKETAGTQPSELNPGDQSYLSKAPRRVIVGRLKKIGGNNGARNLLLPNNRALPEFLCKGRIERRNADGEEVHEDEALYKAEYVYGSWSDTHTCPPCINTEALGTSCNVEDETMALLTEHGLDHGDFPQAVLRNVEMAVRSGVVLPEQQNQDFSETMAAAHDLGWKPTPDMYEGRRDYRKERIFTIDPTTAKDLDDALHIKKLPDGRVEIGVHIADVSHFIQPGTAVDEEAQRRATTVYLVDRTVPMLPRPLCEVACSLNENVERLAFSCVWKMNMDGTLENPDGGAGEDEVWYGKSVIKSCARLDYATAQNIIEGKVATGERPDEMDEELWPKTRRPTGGHTIEQVAGDVLLMNAVAKARRNLRFQSGALALNGIKLAFQLDDDGETPMLCAPYPIRDSNRLVEEYMLLANFLVAQRLITHAGGLALLRQHPPPVEKGIDDVIDVAKAGMGFHIDATSSRTLQISLNRLGRECDDALVLQCITEMLMTPMQPAEYIAAGEVEEEYWRHFALNIPYYTHFTSPIRRYPDVIVHRLLQATIDGEEAVDSFAISEKEVQAISCHCNDKRMASKKAQERSDRVFLALYLRKNPLKSQLGVVLSVGQQTFTVFVPSLGLSSLVFLEEHKNRFTFQSVSDRGSARIVMEPKNGDESLDIKVFTKLKVTCLCKEKPRMDVKLMVDGLWTRN